jgi:hypothetical protein
VRRPGGVDHLVAHLPSLLREPLLKLRLVVDVARQRVLDPPLEGRDDRLLDRLEAVLEEQRAQPSLEQRREDVAIGGKLLEPFRARTFGPLDQLAVEVELARDDGAALP